MKVKQVSVIIPSSTQISFGVRNDSAITIGDSFVYSLNVWYYCKITVNSDATSVNCTIRDIANEETIVLNSNITTNIPKGKQVGIGFGILGAQPTHSPLFDIDYLAFYRF